MPNIKNIFWDVDGVLADLNQAYYTFLTQHPNYKVQYKDLKFEDLDRVLPIDPKYGALELKTHPTMGVQMDYDFCHSEFFEKRPLYPGVIEALKEFHELGFQQFTLSATFNVEAKKKLLSKLLTDVKDFLTIECVQHGQFMHDTAKEDSLKACFEKYGLKADETVLVDDRIYNQYAAIHVGSHPVRYRCPFTTDLPKELEWIPEVHNMDELKELLLSDKIK